MLQWTDPAPPNHDSHYDHVTAKTPFGPLRIEWKSWKDYANFDAMMPWGQHVNGGESLDEAKAAVQNAWDLTVENMKALATPTGEREEYAVKGLDICQTMSKRHGNEDASTALSNAGVYVVAAILGLSLGEAIDWCRSRETATP